MSADLFAAFEATTQPDTQKNQSKSRTVPSVIQNDPFSFFSGTAAAPQPQITPPQQGLQWQQPVSTQTAAPTSLWPTATVVTSPPPAAQPPQFQNASIWGDLGELGGFRAPSEPMNQVSSKAEEEDDWGDFEAPEDAPQISALPDVEPEPVRNRIVRASTIDMLNNKLVDVGISSNPDPPPNQRPEKKEAKPTARTPDPNILFDAADFELQDDGDAEDDDDFGDFEAEPAAAPGLPELVAVSSYGGETQTQAPSLSLAGSTTRNAQTGFGSAGLPGTSSFGATKPKKQPPNLSLTSPTKTGGNGSLYPQAPKSPYGSFQNRKPDPMKELKIKTPQASEFPKEAKPRSPSPVTAWPEVPKDDFDSDWAVFKDLPPDEKPSTTPATTARPADMKPESTLDLSTDATNAGPPPTNVPPPSVLLSIFPQLLDLATTSLLKPISSLPHSSQQLIASNEATVIFLKGHLALATVAARIIAGRKMRWHRDKFLMQGMAISAAGGKGGMKLAGVDKTQSAREDREAAEVESVWKAQVGRLRSAVAAANNAAASSSTPLKVPELSVHVSAHPAQNVVTAAKPCVICGLKRDERIPKVDFDVEDSFGEWWVEHWGHRACRNFWLQHEIKLRQR